MESLIVLVSLIVWYLLLHGFYYCIVSLIVWFLLLYGISDGMSDSMAQGGGVNHTIHALNAAMLA